MTTTADWARFYGQRMGWRVFPVNARKKTPKWSGWLKDATTDPALIDQQFYDDEINIGLLAGETFDAFDIEGEHLSAFSSWMARHGHELPAECPLASTGRGGIHILTRPTGVDGTRRLYLDGTHIGELKSRGGFIVACPSEVDTGDGIGNYDWLYPPTPGWLPEPTGWLRGLLERPVALRKTLPTRLASVDDVVAVLGRLAGSVHYAAEGTRNNYLYWAMRRAIEEGVPQHHALLALRTAALEAGLEADETEKTIESALEAEAVAA